MAQPARMEELRLPREPVYRSIRCTPKRSGNSLFEFRGVLAIFFLNTVIKIVTSVLKIDLASLSEIIIISYIPGTVERSLGAEAPYEYLFQNVKNPCHAPDFSIHSYLIKLPKLKCAFA